MKLHAATLKTSAIITKTKQHTTHSHRHIESDYNSPPTFLEGWGGVGGVGGVGGRVIRSLLVSLLAGWSG